MQNRQKKLQHNPAKEVFPQSLRPPQFDDPDAVHQTQHRVHRVKFPFFHSKIGAVGMFVVIVLKQLTQQKQVERKCVLRMVTVVVIFIAVFVPAPVHHRAMYRPHEKMHRQEQVHPPFGGKKNVKNDVPAAPNQTGRPGITQFVQPVPGGVIAQKIRCYFEAVVNKAIKNPGRMHHHGKNIFKKIG